MSQTKHGATAASARYAAPAAACAADVLRVLARAHEPRSVPELARLLNVSKSLVFRVIRELEARQLVERVEANRFWLGVGALEVGGAYAANADYVATMRSLLRELAGRFDEVAHLGILRGRDILYLLNHEAPSAILGISYAGKRLPANCTALGKALLAGLENEEVAALFDGEYARLTSRSIGSLDELLRDLAQVRERGYATADGDAIIGRFAVAVRTAVPGLAEPAAIAISGSEERLKPRRDELAAALLEASERLRAERRARVALQGRPPSSGWNGV
jgi:DNA-binding IclR family transcriptional regulator